MACPAVFLTLRQQGSTMMPNSTKEKTNRPVNEIRLGRIKAAIWENESKDGLIRHNVKLTRIYKDGDIGRIRTALAETIC